MWEGEDFSNFTQKRNRSSLFCAPSSFWRPLEVSEVAYSHSILCSKDVQRYSTRKYENCFVWGKLNSPWNMRNRPTITHLHELSCHAYRYLNVVMRLTYIAVSSVPLLPKARPTCHTSSEHSDHLFPVLLTCFAQYLPSKTACQSTGRDCLSLNLYFPHYWSNLIAKEITVCQKKPSVDSKMKSDQ